MIQHTPRTLSKHVWKLQEYERREHTRAGKRHVTGRYKYRRKKPDGQFEFTVEERLIDIYKV